MFKMLVNVDCKKTGENFTVCTISVNGRVIVYISDLVSGADILPVNG